LFSQFDRAFTAKLLPTLGTLGTLAKVILVRQTDWTRIDGIISVVGGVVFVV
jgi:Co/Zn/Cd efflux system component